VGVIVPSFSYVAWALAYPELANASGVYPDGSPWSMTDTVATMLWTDAGLPGGYFRNDGLGPCNDVATQASILNKITAHLAALWIRRQRDQEMAFIVGRVSTGAQGGVSGSFANEYPAGTVQWWQQTEYGSDAWAQCAPFRGARFVSGPVRRMDTYWPLAY